METDAYTPDAICRSLGIGDFHEKWKRGQPNKQLRIVLCPSFDPELFIRLSDDGGKLIASVTAARTHIWGLPSPGLVTADQATVELVGWSFDDLESAFRNALASPPRSVVTLDGMPSHVLLQSYSTIIEVQDNPHGTPLAGFLAAIVEQIYVAVENIRCRNGLAHAGKYLGLKLAVEPEAELEIATRMMVLGTPQDQGEVLAALAKVAARQKPRKAETND